MSDLFQWWHQALTILPNGDLMVCRGIEPTGSLTPSSATVEGEQRVLRRLLTSPGSYIWHLEYGAGLPAYVGQPVQTGPLSAREVPERLPEELNTLCPAPLLPEDKLTPLRAPLLRATALA